MANTRIIRPASTVQARRPEPQRPDARLGRIPTFGDGDLTKRQALEIFAYAAYAQLSGDDGSSPTTLGAAWTPVDWYAQEITPRGFVTSLANGTFQFVREGVYGFSVYMSFNHNEMNSGRQTMIRLFNVTDGVGTDGTVVPTGRNTPATVVPLTSLIEITATGLNDDWRLEIGNGDSYSAVVFDSTVLSLWNVGEFRGTL